MRLSAQVLKSKLEEVYTLKAGNHIGNNLCLSRPMFYEQGMELKENKIYIVEKYEYLPEERLIPQGLLLLVIGKEESAGDTDGSDNVFEFPVNCSSFQLFNKVQEIFDLYDEWEYILQSAADEEKNLQVVMDESVGIFGNPLTVSTSDFFMLSYSVIFEENEKLTELIDPNNLFEYSNAFKQDPEYNQARTIRQPFLFPEYITGYRSLCMNIFDHGIYAYRIAIPEVLQEFKPGMMELVQYLAGYIEKVLRKLCITKETKVFSLYRILKEILEDENRNQAQIEHNLSEYGWNETHQYVCMSFKVAMLDRKNMTVNFICHHIESLVPGACAFQYKSDIAVFINLTGFGGTLEDVCGRLVYFLRDSYLKVGISNEFVGFSEMKYFYYQAQVALDTGSRNHKYQWIHRFDEVILLYLLEQGVKEFPPHLCASRKLLELKKYDAQHHTDFYDTLRIYLVNHLNAVQSAKVLYIHRSTFLYRMERIKELISLDTDNQDMVLYLMISYRLLESKN